MAPTKARLDLKARFVRNAIPTEQDFKDLIDAPLNQSDDGIFRNSGEPLSIVAGSDPQKRVLRFYGDPPSGATVPDWVISLNPSLNASTPQSSQTGLGITSGDGTLRLFIDATGKIGIGTNRPSAGLEIDQGSTNDVALRLTASGPGWGSGLQLNNTAPGETNFGIYSGFGGLHFADCDKSADRLVITGDGRIGIGTSSPGHLLDVNGEMSVNGAMGVASNLTVAGEIAVAGSELYFTKTDHNWDSKADVAGMATIQNSAGGFQALMIVGRAGAPHPTKPGVALRVVKLWDFLDVNGEMRVTGPFLEVKGGGTERAYLGGDGAGGDVQIGSLNPAVDVVSAYNAGRGAYMRFFCSTLTQTSDLSLKTNIRDLTGELEAICRLRPVRFNWKTTLGDEVIAGSLTEDQLGLIAQEVAEVLPEVVSENRGTLAIAYTSLVPVLVGAIQELHQRVTLLEPGDQPAATAE